MRFRLTLVVFSSEFVASRRVRARRAVLALALVAATFPAASYASPRDDSRRLFAEGRFLAADSLSRQELDALRRSRAPELEIAEALVDAGTSAAAIMEFDRATRHFAEALRIREQLLAPADSHVIEAQRGLAAALAGSVRYAEAESLAAVAHADAQRALGNDHMETLACDRTLGSILRWRGRLEESESFLRRAVEGYSRVESPPKLELAATRVTLASLLWRIGFVDEAEALLLPALEVREGALGRHHPLVADVLEEFAWVAQTRGDYARAEAFVREALAIRQRFFPSEHPITIRTLLAVGDILTGSAENQLDSARVAEGESFLRRAMSLSAKVHGEESAIHGEIVSNLGWNLMVQWRPDEAAALLDRAAKIRKSSIGENDPLLTQLAHRKARVAYARGDYAGAEAALRELLTRFPVTSRDYLSVLEGLGIMRGTQGDFAEAAEFLGQAASAFELSRVRAGEGLARAAFWGSPYERFAGALLEIGRDDEAWSAVERLHGLALADILFATGERTLAPRDAAREDSLATRLGDLENRLGIASAAAAEDPDARARVDSLSRELTHAEAAWNSLRSEITREHPVTEGRTYPLSRVQAVLDPRTAIIGWLDPEFGFESRIAWGYVIRDRGAVKWVRLSSALSPDSTAGWAARHFREELTAPARSALPVSSDAVAPSDVVRHLWSDRIEPLLPHLEGVETIVVVPSRAVRSVPIEAIARPDGGDLVDRFAVQYAPSATIYAWLREQARSSRASPADRRALLVGDPPFREEHVAEIPADGGIETVSYALTAVSDSALSRVLRGERDALGSLPRLAWARREIDGIAAVTKNADRLVGQDASEARLRAIVSDGRMGHYDVVHFATHAIIDNERPEISTLVLSQVKDAEAPAPNAQAQAIDGIVSASEIMREWSLDAELAVLSGCETALGLRTIDGTWGLAQTFLQAGARSVVVSLWPVDDEATALLMTKFYELWTAPPAAEPARTVGAPPPAGKAGALSAAKRWLRDLEDPIGSRRFAHPYFWSGFVLIGDGS